MWLYQLLREVVISGVEGTVTTYAGQCGVSNYTGLLLNFLFAVNTVLIVLVSGDLLAPLQATFNYPSGLAFSPDGKIVSLM